MKPSSGLWLWSALAACGGVGSGGGAQDVVTTDVVLAGSASYDSQAITAVVAAEGREPSAIEGRDAAAFLHQGQQLRALTIASGVLGGVAIITGAVLRARGLRRARSTADVGMLELRF